MAFEEVHAARTQNTAFKGQVGCALYISKEKHALELTILAETIAVLGWKIGDAVRVLEGTGADACMIQIVAVPAGTKGCYTLSKRNGNNLSASIKFLVQVLKYHDVTSDVLISMRDVAYQKFGSTLTVSLEEFIKPKTT